MSSGYAQFTNEEEADSPPQYEKSRHEFDQAPTAPQHQLPQYPVQSGNLQNIELSPQGQQQQTGHSGYPIQQQPATFVYQAPYGQVPVQQTIQHGQMGPAAKDYFGFALFVTICCCLPLGIVALIRSSEVKNRSAIGDQTGAMLSSKEAQRYSWVGCAIGGIFWLIALVILAIYIALVVVACGGYC